MLTCEQCQAALLDRHYGLLDTAEAADLDRHIAACPSCKTAQQRVERFGRLLSAAARTEFPDVRFVAPAETVSREAEALRSGARSRSRAPLRISANRVGWFVAAGLLLGLGIPTGMHLQTAARQRSELAAAVEKRDDLERQRRDGTAQFAAAVKAVETDLTKAQADYQKAETTRNLKLAEVQAELAAKQFDVVISGPRAIQAGAPSEYHIQTRDLTGKLAPATVTYKIKDQTNKAVIEPRTVAMAGDVAISIPADVPLKPNGNLWLEVAASRTDGAKAELREQLKLAPPVYATHLTTDKPLYQPGEVVHFRSLTLDRATLKPAEEALNVQFVVRDALGTETAIVAGGNQVAAADGKPIIGPDGKPIHGIGAGEWTIPAEAKGGEYTLAIKEANGRFPEERRKFLVNQYQAARLNKELEWAKKSFGPGDEVIANCKVTNAAGPIAGKPVAAEAVVDGRRIAVPCGPTGADGTVAVRFTLPNQITKGQGSLNVSFTDGGNVDSINKPIPIALKKLVVDFYSEGGDLVAGAPNRVYFQVHTTLGKPADLKGRVVDETGRVVANAETLTDNAEPGINQGMGRFEFTPEIGQKYRLLIDQPVGTEGEYNLPVVKAEGIVLTAISEVSSDPDPIRVRVACPSVARTLLVGAYVRGRLLDHRRVLVEANQRAEVDLKPDAGIGGVTRITVFEELPGDGTHKTLLPRAERLVYRRPAAALNLIAEPDKARYVPGERVTLSLKATNEKGEAAPAIACIGVVNKSVVTMADEKTFRTMPTHFLLTSEVRRPEDLEHADVLLGSHPKAAAALDLLLGTQGWRRFAEQNIPPSNPADDGDRIFLATAHSPRIETNALALAREKVEETYGPAATEAQARFTAAAERYHRLRADKHYVEQNQRLGTQIADARSVAQAAQAKMAATLEVRDRVLRWAAPALCGLFLVIALIALVAGLWRGLRYYLTAAGSLGLAAAAAGVLAFNLGNGGGEPGEQMASADRVTALATASAANNAPADDFALSFFFKTDENGLLMDGANNWRFAENGKLGEQRNLPLGGGMPANRARGLGLGGIAPPAPAAAPAPPAPAEPRGAAADMKKDFLREEQKDGEALLQLGRDKSEAKKPQGMDLADMPGKADVKMAGNRAVRQLINGDAKPQAPVPGLQAAGGRRDFAFGGLEAEVDMAKRLGRDRFNLGWQQPAPPPPFVVREYAHKHIASAAGDRTDFAETVFWQPVLILPNDGAKVSFDLSDEVTRYQVLVAAHTLNGRIGACESLLEARKPFSVEPKLPVEITAGDRIDVPVTLANDTDVSRTVAVSAHPRGLTLTHGNLDDRLALGSQQSARRIFSFEPSIVQGTAELRLVGRSDPFGDDAVVRKIPVVPNGFPIIGTVSGVVDGVARHEVVLPQTWIAGTLKCQVSVYPSTLAELQKGLEGLLREPGGCFEQTSTTNYPNALVLQYLRESNQANPAAMKQAKEMLERGYAKLTAFEVPEASKREGFEWFGQAPAHEALTAYGLMQFRDMARVTDVDPKLLDRTRTYLLGRRDGRGGFTRNPLALDTFGRAPADVTNAYIVWALTESGKDDDISKELNLLAEEAKTSDDPYFLALVANALLNRDRSDEANAILRKLATKLTKDGYLDGAKTSITGSSGRTLEIETTALAVLGWLKSNSSAEFTPAVRAAVGWIGKQRGGYGGFGSTQSTILALKALIAYTKANKKTAEAGELAIGVGERVISKIAFAAGVQDALTVELPDAEHQLKPGKNDVRVTMTGKNSFPYTLTWSYQTLQPPSAEGCAVRLTTALDRPKLAEGEATHLNVKLENVSGKGQGMTVAILGLPAGLKLPDDFAQLKDLAKPRENGKKPGQIGSFEVRGRELVLYWRDLAPDAKIDLNLDLRALVPGAYHGPASRAYLYYDADAKCWTTPLAATIEAKE